MKPTSDQASTRRLLGDRSSWPSPDGLDTMVEYSAIADRAPFLLPNSERVAVIIAVNLEHYEFVPPANRYKNEYLGKTRYPDVVGYGYRDYGNRVGIWRLLEVLDRFDCKVTCTLNTEVLDMFPEVGAATAERDWTYMFHGRYNTRYLFGLSEDEERSLYLSAIDHVYARTGKRMRGMLGPGFSSSANTPSLMAEVGMTYTMDWFVDDQPFLLRTPNGPLVGVPYSRELNDSAVMSGPPYYAHGGEFFARACKRQFDVLWEEGGTSGRVMTLAVHPFLLGLPDQVQYLADALCYMSSKGGVWWTTSEEVADHYLGEMT
ncbi:polysaccharide deacetylase family protein [Streptomyces sp. NPDC004227]